MSDLRVCPKCNGTTNTYRHKNAKVWCPNCGFVLREEGGQPSELLFHPESPGVRIQVTRSFFGRWFKPTHFATLREVLKGRKG